MNKMLKDIGYCRFHANILKKEDNAPPKSNKKTFLV